MTPQIILGPSVHEFRRQLPRPACPRCGEPHLAAAASELVDCGQIRHSWSCDSCGHDFVTDVRLAPALVPADDVDEGH
jgi:transposase-like protein